MNKTMSERHQVSFLESADLTFKKRTRAVFNKDEFFMRGNNPHAHTSSAIQRSNLSGFCFLLFVLFFVFGRFIIFERGTCLGSPISLSIALSAMSRFSTLDVQTTRPYEFALQRLPFHIMPLSAHFRSRNCLRECPTRQRSSAGCIPRWGW